MEQASLPKKSQFSSIYLSERNDLTDFQTEPISRPNLEPENSALIRLLSPSLLSQKEIGTLDQPLYNENILKLLDDLQCPVLLLPRIKKETSTQRIAFLADVLFTSKATLASLTRIARSLRANITLFNIAEPALPEMDPGYAKKHFTEQGLSEVNGVKVKLLNVRKRTNDEALEEIFNQHRITLIAATRQRKDLLYKLVS